MAHALNFSHGGTAKIIPVISACFVGCEKTHNALSCPPLRMQVNSPVASAANVSVRTNEARMDFLDATRAFALVLGILFHAALSLNPVRPQWAVHDVSMFRFMPHICAVCHSFRLETFFLISGFFSHRVFHRKGPRHFARSRLLRIGVPFVLGWFILHPVLIGEWELGATVNGGHSDLRAGVKAGAQAVTNLPSHLFTETHLWFLYYLLLITGACLLLRAPAAAIDRSEIPLRQALDRALRAVVRSPASLLVYVLLTSVPLWCMTGWEVDTPQSTLVPEIPVLLLYGGFFLFGWALDRQPELVSSFGQLTRIRALEVLASAAATAYFTRFQTRGPGLSYEFGHVAFVVSYAAMMWTLVRLTLGVFQKFCSQPRAWIRYIADSSYWLYLIHLPIVVAFQIALAHAPLPWYIKLVAFAVPTLIISLLSYDWCVRPTVVGEVLNGRRRQRVLFE